MDKVQLNAEQTYTHTPLASPPLAAFSHLKLLSRKRQSGCVRREQWGSGSHSQLWMWCGRDGDD